MSPQEFIGKLTSFSNAQERLEFLRENFLLVNEEESEQLAVGLLDKVIGFMREDTLLSIEIAELILEYAALRGNELHRAMGLRAKAQAIANGKGAYREVLPLYEEAIAVHQSYRDEYGEALVYVTYIWVLGIVGRYQEAIEKGEWAIPILKKKPDLGKLASLSNNLALVHLRIGHYSQAYEMFSETVRLYNELGEDWAPSLPNTENNRALTLFNLGQFQKAVEVATLALGLAETYKQTPVLARIQHTLGMIKFFQGKYNEALQLYDEAQTTHRALEQWHEVALCQLSKTDCLLELRRFKEVVENCEEIKQLFQELVMRKEVAEAIRNQASAFVGLKQYEQAIQSLQEARRIFVEEGHLLRAAYVDFQAAICFRQKKQIHESIQAAISCIQTFDEMELVLEASLARILAGWELASEGKIEEALGMANEVSAIIQMRQWPQLKYEVLHLKGQLARLQDQQSEALEYLTNAVFELENLRGNVMVEYRVNFVEDKQLVYENIVNLCIDLGQINKGLEYAERAKSRTLLELLQYHVDQGIELRDVKDEPLVAQIHQRRAEREQKLQYAVMLLETSPTESQEKILELQQEIQSLESQITDLWHQLLVRNKDYAGDVSLWEVTTESFQPYLASDMLLVEYFIVDDQFIVFIVGDDSDQANSAQVFHLSVKIFQVERLLQQLYLNFSMTGHSSSGSADGLVKNSQGILNRLYQMLVAPIEQRIKDCPRLVIVPHGPLHYLPFHALYDNHEQYLIETHQISYLPSASLLRFCRETKPVTDGCLVIGHSFKGRLPYAVEEARRIAELWGTQAICEEQARISEIQTQVSDYRLIHIASHGDFRPDNPLFSGLALEEGSLTTLDVFHLRLRSSLVTLSACQTGRSIVGGGDELLGLARAFLSAGSISLLLALWPVSDRSTIQWMERFYTLLKAGKTKGEAIQTAQTEFIKNLGEGEENYRHPFYWAPFFLIGDEGEL